MTRSALLTLTMLLVPALVHGQAHLGLGLGYSGLTGDDFSDYQGSITFGGHVMFDASESFQLGAGIDITNFGIVDVEEKVRQWDYFGVGRLLLPGEGARFFLGGKLGLSRQTAEVLTDALSANGFAVGPLAGVQIPIGSAAFDVSGELLYQSFGDVDISGSTVADSGASGFRFVLRGVLDIALGS